MGWEMAGSSLVEPAGWNQPGADFVYKLTRCPWEGTMRTKKIIIPLIFMLVLVALGLVLINECAFGGGMAAAYKSCDCLGKEWELYDQTAADGPRKTLCLGIVRSTSCYSFLEGPEIECKTR